jgi:hypothetical protein
MKTAWRDGSWWRDDDMRLRYLITAGGVVLLVSVFALFAVLFDPPAVRLLLCATVVYVLVRLAATVWRAPS